MVPRALAVVGAVVLCLAGCSGTDERATDSTAGPASGSATGTGPAPGGEPAPSSPHGAPASASSLSSAAAPSVQVSTGAGPCPYLAQDFIEQTVGQRIASVVVTSTEPPPGPRPQCDFVRAGGDVAASVRTETVAPGAGLDAALARVPGGNPVDAGEGGSVRVDGAQSRTALAAFKGTVLVLVTINQASSIEAVEIADQVLAGL